MLLHPFCIMLPGGASFGHFILEVAMKNSRIKKICVLAVLAALSYVLMMVGRIPVVAFLKYDPKDVIITFAGFLYGPFSALAVSLVVSLIEMFTVSDTGIIGFAMNVLSSCAFACTAAMIYRRKHTLSGAVLGVILGTVCMVIVMLLWNYILTPLYMDTSREYVASILPTVFLPFNLLKGTLNAALSLLLYRPLVTGLRGARLFPKSTSTATVKTGSKVLLWVIASLVLVICILVILLFQGVIQF